MGIWMSSCLDDSRDPSMLTRRPSSTSRQTGGKRGDGNRADWVWDFNHWTKLKANKERDRDVPKCRSGHACVQIGHYMYIIGGYSDGICFSDVYILDLDSHQWRHVENSGTVVQGRASHCCCVGPGDKDIYMFGGSGPCWGRTNLGDLCKFDTEKEEWSIMPLRGQMPPPGYGQSLCRYENRLILFGGTCGSFFYNHLFEFDTIEQVWTRLQTQGRPPNPRYKHQAVVLGDSMFVLGGGQYSPEEGPMDIYRLDLVNMVWSQHDLGCMAPQARIAHTCVVDEQNSQILIFGGRSASEMKLHDLYAWDVKRQSLKLLAGGSQEEHGPPGREFHCACFYDGQMFIFGGSTGTRRMNDTWRYKLELSPPSLQILAAHAVLQHTDDVEELRGRLPEEVMECLRMLRPNAFKFTAGIMR